MINFQVAYAQSNYQVGKGQASIEPGPEMLSLALAGYGLPRDGRFSLEWKALSNVGEATDAAMATDGLFVLREGHIWYVDLVDGAEGVELTSRNDLGEIRWLAAGDKKLFAGSAVK